MSMKRRGWRSFCALGFFAVGCVAAACATGDAEQGDFLEEGPSTEVGEAITTALFSGTVKNDAGAPVVGATVNINGAIRYTDTNGNYAVSVIASPTGYMVSVSKAGYMPESEFSSTGKTGTAHWLAPADVKTINPTVQNTVVASSGASVTFEPNSFVDANNVPVTTSVNVTIGSYKPRDMPGDFTGKNAAGQLVAIESIGAMYVNATLASTGANLRLAVGKTAAAFIPKPLEFQSGMPPCTLNGKCNTQMWKYDGKNWVQKNAGIKVTASGTQFSLIAAAPGDDLLGLWNADIDKTDKAACTIIELVGIPPECYNPLASPTEPGIKITATLPTSGYDTVTRQDTVKLQMPYVALYNIRPDDMQTIAIEFPAPVPANCTGKLSIESDMPVAGGDYPKITSTGGYTRFSSGHSWGGVGYPTNSMGVPITSADITSKTDPCGSHVQFIYTP